MDGMGRNCEKICRTFLDGVSEAPKMNDWKKRPWNLIPGYPKANHKISPFSWPFQSTIFSLSNFQGVHNANYTTLWYGPRSPLSHVHKSSSWRVSGPIGVGLCLNQKITTAWKTAAPSKITAGTLKITWNWKRNNIGHANLHFLGNFQPLIFRSPKPFLHIFQQNSDSFISMSPRFYLLPIVDPISCSTSEQWPKPWLFLLYIRDCYYPIIYIYINIYNINNILIYIQGLLSHEIRTVINQPDTVLVMPTTWFCFPESRWVSQRKRDCLMPLATPSATWRLWLLTLTSPSRRRSAARNDLAADCHRVEHPEIPGSKYR